MAACKLTTPSLINIDYGFATPFASNKLDHSFTGSIYDAKGHICQNSQRTTLGNNEWNPNDTPSITPPSHLNFIKGRSLYLGHYTGHYGHFLIETLSRFWAIHKIDDHQFYDNFIFHRTSVRLKIEFRSCCKALETSVFSNTETDKICSKV